jgi:hypothetical protein
MQMQGVCNSVVFEEFTKTHTTKVKIDVLLRRHRRACGGLFRSFRLLCFFFRDVGGIFCFKGRGKAVLSAVVRRRVVRARGSLDVC